MTALLALLGSGLKSAKILDAGIYSYLGPSIQYLYKMILCCSTIKERANLEGSKNIHMTTYMYVYVCVFICIMIS